jgi:hypothetical protein
VSCGWPKERLTVDIDVTALGVWNDTLHHRRVCFISHHVTLHLLEHSQAHRKTMNVNVNIASATCTPVASRISWVAVGQPDSLAEKYD